MNYEKVKTTARELKITLKSLAQKIDLTEHGFHAAIKNDTLKVRDLEKIAVIFGVNPGFFFNDDNNTDSNSKTLQPVLNQKETEINYLNTQIVDLRDQIKLLNDIILLLKSKA